MTFGRAPVAVPRYLERFRCIAERCEDTCCAGLRIPLSASESASLQTRLGPAFTADGALPATSEGACTLLESSGLCSVHRRFGVEALPVACAAFPRGVVDEGAHAEGVGSLACPELVRQVLADDAFEKVLLPGDGRASVEASSRTATLRAGRAALLELLGLGERLDATLFHAARHAAAVDVGAGTDVPSPLTLPPSDGVPRWPPAALALGALRTLATRPGLPGRRAHAWLGEPSPAGTARALSEAGEPTRPAGEQAPLLASDGLTPHILWDRFAERQALLSDSARTELDAVLRRYVHHELSRIDPSAGVPLLVDVLGVLARAAVVRVWWVLHPTHDTVTVLQTFSKYVARSAEFVSRVFPEHQDSPPELLGRCWLFAVAHAPT